MHRIVEEGHCPQMHGSWEEGPRPQMDGQRLVSKCSWAPPSAWCGLQTVLTNLNPVPLYWVTGKHFLLQPCSDSQ